MMASILAFLKALIELLGFSKWLYNSTKKTPAQKEQDIEVANRKEEDEASTSGRPKWD